MTDIRMPRPSAGTGRSWTLAVTAMLSVQVGSALSVHLITAVGAAGPRWLRLSIGAVIFRRCPVRRCASFAAAIPAVLGLGITTGLQTIAFLAAIERIRSAPPSPSNSSAR